MVLGTREYKPYMKPNNIPIYTHEENNHLSNIINLKTLQKASTNLLNLLTYTSSNESTFNTGTNELRSTEQKWIHIQVKIQTTENNSKNKNTAKKNHMVEYTNSKKVDRNTEEDSKPCGHKLSTFKQSA